MSGFAGEHGHTADGGEEGLTVDGQMVGVLLRDDGIIVGIATFDEPRLILAVSRSRFEVIAESR